MFNTLADQNCCSAAVCFGLCGGKYRLQTGRFAVGRDESHLRDKCRACVASATFACFHLLQPRLLAVWLLQCSVCP